MRTIALRRAQSARPPGEFAAQCVDHKWAGPVLWVEPWYSLLFSLDSNLHQSVAVAWNRIVRAFPFPFDLHARLRCRMAKSMVDSRQRAFIHLRQHLHTNGHFFISRGVSRRIGLASGQPIHWRFARIHRHVELLVVDAIGDQGAHADLAVARAELHACAALNAAVAGELGRYFDPRIRRLLTDS